MKIVLGIILGFIMLAIIGMMLPVPDDGKTDRERQAYLISRDFVRQNLVSPSSASFPNSGDLEISVKAIGPDIYQVRGWVESKNPLGVMLKKHYYATVKYVGGDEWRLIGKVDFF